MDPTEELYKRNFELSIRNKTLSVLRTLYAISMSTLDVAKVSQKIVDTIVDELKFSAALISLVDPARNILYTAAITQSASIDEAVKLFGKPLSEITVPLNNPNNLLNSAINSRSRQISSNLLDILIPHATQEMADQIAHSVNLKTLIVHPLILGDKVLGTLTVGLAKNADDLSQAEKETLDELIDVVSLAIDRAQLHESLQRANKQLEALDQLKDEFVSIASHELRTPMTAIKSYTWLVLNKFSSQMDPKAADYLRKTYDSTERLIHLVSEMLDISRIESGRVQLTLAPLDLVQLASDIQHEFAPKSTELRLELSVQPQGEIPNVSADREKIHQVLENLVGNAFKFTPAGGRITIRLEATGDFVQISVSDTGKGISPSDLDKLFTKFGRTEGSLTTMASSSSGLGLYICKQYVEMHHGQIWAQSQPGSGTSIYFTLPIAKPN